MSEESRTRDSEARVRAISFRTAARHAPRTAGRGGDRSSGASASGEGRVMERRASATRDAVRVRLTRRARSGE